CVVFKVCVHNTGNQALDNVAINDTKLGATVTIPSVAIGATECKTIGAQADTNTVCTGPGGSCLCSDTLTATSGTNTGTVTSATCHDTATQACDNIASKCSDTSTQSCSVCQAKVDKTVALDTNCDGVADDPVNGFKKSVTQDSTKCVVYQICATN